MAMPGLAVQDLPQAEAPPLTPFRAAIAALAAGRTAAAVPLLEAAIRSGDGGPLAGLNLGMALETLGRLREAEPYLQAAATALPGLAEPHLRLGNIAALRNEPGPAAEHFRAVLRRDPQNVLALAALASIEQAAGRLDAARLLIARARTIDPAEPELELAAGRIELLHGQAEAARAAAEAVLAKRPAHARAAHLLAEALLLGGTPQAALDYLAGRAAADPFAAGWPLAASVVHKAAGNYAAALAELQTAEVLAPESGEIQAELGRAQASAGRTGEAEAALRAAIAQRPADLDLRNRLATVLWRGHRLTEMLAVLETALAEFGPHPALNMNKALALNAQGRQQEAMEAADAAVAASESAVPPLVNRIAVLPYHPQLGTAAELLACGRAIAARLGPPAVVQHPHSRDPERRLRIGLLSGGLGIHPVGWLTLAGFEALPEAEFEIAAYSLKHRPDFLNTRFRARSALWRDVFEAEESGIAAMVAADQVDILIDMGGYGEGGRPFVLNHRPAPVQMKWVGAQFSTTGLDCVDWMITDRWETPPGFERFYSERLLRLPDGYLCYLPAPYAPDVGPLPARRNGHITFGCYNNMTKITPQVLQAWARILHAMPEARMVVRTHALNDAATYEFTEQRMLQAGLPMDRMTLHAGCPHSDLLAAYNEIDIALDPFPYTGGLTVCEALWMGVPVLSLAGDSFASRHALSHLSNVGLPDWVVHSPEEYVQQALRRAADRDALEALRAGLRARVAASPLCDAPRFGRNLATALRGAWREWCAAGQGCA